MKRTQKIAQLRAMLAHMRPAGSKTERAFAEHYLRPLGARPDMHGNWIARVLGQGHERVLWSAHTDTVHKTEGMQTIERTDQYLHLPRMTRSSCLGADDTIGVWLLAHMIRRRIPGVYVFHAGEEIGCVGSRAIVRECPKWLEPIEIAIALDRKGTTDVITHMGQRTCSDLFADQLARMIGMKYAACDSGVLTDTLEYCDDVSECTNLSIGYERAHSDNEYCDMDHAIALLDRLCAIDLCALNTWRDPAEYVEPVRHEYEPMWYQERDHTRSRYLDPAYDELAQYFKHMKIAEETNTCIDCGEPLRDRITLCYRCAAESDLAAFKRAADMRRSTTTD